MENAADWAMVFVSTLGSLVGVYIAASVRKLSLISERAQATQNIYDQWVRKKELSISTPAITKMDRVLYNQLDPDCDIENQQVRIWLILIIDIIFNSYVASKKGLYAEEIYKEDLRVHLGAIAKYDSKLLNDLMIERGYFGAGVLGEFYAEVSSLRDTISNST